MLSKEKLINDVNEKEYIPMLKEVNIPDFTKCIAQFSGLHINEVCDDVIKSYLLTWAKNKYRFYQMFGNKLRLDTKITYKEEKIDTDSIIEELERDFPTFALWLDGFHYIKSNKIYARDIDYNVNRMIKKVFPDFRIDGSLVTHFFKSYLKAPDELVTKMGRIWEHQKIEGVYTLSIDPVDMMLASENPYNWVSCYRLECGNTGSHADGCLAAVLDSSSVITYIWNREGKFSLYDNYDFKNIRYYRMREWISIAPNNQAIHFNKIYPGKAYSNEFEKQLREVVENIINKEAIWTHNTTTATKCIRVSSYGYSEFSYDFIYKIKDSNDVIWKVYDEGILCPCGCNNYLIGSDGSEDEDGNMYDYNGDGFIYENFYIEEEEELEGEYCEYIDDYCDNLDCQHCVYWNEQHPICELDETEDCDRVNEADIDCFDAYESNIVSCGRHCEGCPLYEKLHPDEQDIKVVSNDTVAAVTCTPEQLQQTITLTENNLYTTENCIQIANISHQEISNVDLSNDTAIWNTYPDEEPQNPIE